MLQVEHRTREYFGEQALTAHAGAQRFMRGYGGGRRSSRLRVLALSRFWVGSEAIPTPLTIRDRKD